VPDRLRSARLTARHCFSAATTAAPTIPAFGAEPGVSADSSASRTTQTRDPSRLGLPTPLLLLLKEALIGALREAIADEVGDHVEEESDGPEYGDPVGPINPGV